MGADLCNFGTDDYLIVSDYYSNYFEIRYLQEITSESTISAMKEIFATHGIPEYVISDNGPQFSSHKF